jgi:cold shock protein
MSIGTVKWFDAKKGFGFVLNSAGKDVFVHFSNIQCEGFRTLEETDQVEYQEHEGAKGLYATEVRPVARAAAGQESKESAATPV